MLLVVIFWVSIQQAFATVSAFSAFCPTLKWTYSYEGIRYDRPSKNIRVIYSSDVGRDYLENEEFYPIVIAYFVNQQSGKHLTCYDAIFLYHLVCQLISC